MEYSIPINNERIRNNQNIMKKIILFLGILVSMSTIAQTYADKPFIQDYADKYELESKISSELFQVRSNRNKLINVVSEGKLLHNSDKELVADVFYRPFEAMEIMAIDSYKDQIVYLTDKTVLSNAFSGKYYLSHRLENPTQFVIGTDFTTLVAEIGKLILFEEEKEVWSKLVADFNPIKLVFDESGDRFLMLTSEGIYQLLAKSNKFSQVYKGTDLTSMTLHNNAIVVGTKDGVLRLDTESFKASEIDQKLPNNEITSLASIDGNLGLGQRMEHLNYEVMASMIIMLLKDGW